MDSSSRTTSPTTHGPEAAYSLSDQTVSREVDFVEEIGNGNWGSVWLARSKRSRVPSEHVAFRDAGHKFAIKLVHRSKTSANASRIKSLWNEMKIIRTLKDKSHPSIISFHSFIMTPSYAMITMTYLPTLIPVEVQENKCREWFRSLLSGVDFLHRRGVVHNDIKPANILLSHSSVPVLVDFGFAELKDLKDETSFHSNLTYGTPEYLSPERARGITHDTRKSDVWSLGVTFFEIITGRTPFEEYDGDALQSKEDVEKYWSRTLRGKWVGAWDFSEKLEKLLRRMMSPNADLRCTASQAMTDAYWVNKRDSQLAQSFASSLAFERDLDKLLSMTPPKTKAKGVPSREAQPVTPPGLEAQQRVTVLRQSASHSSLIRTRSHPKIAVKTSSKLQPRKRAVPNVDLSPIKGSPPASPARRSAVAKENAQSRLNPNATPKKARRPLGAVLTPENKNMSSSISHIPVKRLDEMTSKRRSSVFAELKRSKSNLGSTAKDASIGSRSGKQKASNNVKDRVLEWEREKQRLREMERLEELERERDEHFEKERQERERMAGTTSRDGGEEQQQREKVVEEEPQQQSLEEEAFMIVVKRQKSKPALNGAGQRGTPVKATPSKANAKKGKVNKENSAVDKENAGPTKQQRNIYRPSSPSVSQVASPLGSRIMNTLPTPTPLTPLVSPKQSKQNIFKHSIKASIDKTLQFYKSSSIGRATAGGSTSRNASIDLTKELAERRSATWLRTQTPAATEESTPAMSPMATPPVTVTSPLASAKNAPVTNSLLSETQMDRMAIWMKNVEKVVEEAHANLGASTSNDEYQQAPLPVPPSQVRQRPSRLPRRVLAASQIFDESGASFSVNNINSVTSTAPPSAYHGPQTSTTALGGLSSGAPSTTVSPTGSEFVMSDMVTPGRPRRATVSTRAGSSPPGVMLGGDLDSSFDSSLNPKSRGHMSMAQLNPASAPHSPKLSEVVNRNLFVAPAYTSRDNLLDMAGRDTSFDDEGSICHVEPYPQRRSESYARYVDTPERQHMESVYDRFLMTSGVKRNGKGYQSEAPPVTIGSGSNSKKDAPPSSHRAFYTARKPMPPPVSSEDVPVMVGRRAASVDELGMMHAAHGEFVGGDGLGLGATPMVGKDGGSTVALVRRAFKAIVPGNRRTSRAY